MKGVYGHGKGSAYSRLNPQASKVVASATKYHTFRPPLSALARRSSQTSCLTEDQARRSQAKALPNARPIASNWSRQADPASRWGRNSPATNSAPPARPGKHRARPQHHRGNSAKKEAPCGSTHTCTSAAASFNSPCPTRTTYRRRMSSSSPRLRHRAVLSRGSKLPRRSRLRWRHPGFQHRQPDEPRKT